MAEDANKIEEKKEVKYFLIEGRLLQAIGNYLSGKPYSEVDRLIEGLKQLQVANFATEDESKKGE